MYRYVFAADNVNVSCKNFRNIERKQFTAMRHVPIWFLFFYKSEFLSSFVPISVNSRGTVALERKSKNQVDLEKYHFS